MNKKAVLRGLLSFAEDDGLGLWVIANDVEELLGIADPMANLEITIGLVTQLLACRRLAGDKRCGPFQTVARPGSAGHRRFHTA